MVYFCMMGVTFFLSVVCGKKYREYCCPAVGKQMTLKPLFWPFISFLPIYLVYSCQYGLHSDYDTYRTYFNQILEGNRLIRDTGFYFLSAVLAKSGFPFQSIYFAIYLIAFLILAKCLQEGADDWAVSLVLFSTVFFLLGFYYIRQLVAVCIALWSIRDIAERKLRRFLCLTGVAALFHVSALVMLPMYFLLSTDFRFSSYFFAAMVLGCVAVFQRQILLAMIRVFFPDYLNRYEVFRSVAMNPWDTLWVLALALFLFWIWGAVHRAGGTDRIAANALAVYLLLYFGCRWLFELERFGYYVHIPVLLLAGNAERYTSKPKEGIFWKLTLIAAALISFWGKFHAEPLFRYRAFFLP